MLVRSVLVSGGGISGLALAAGLARQGVRVDVVEARADRGASGVGISVPNNALRMLARLGVLEDCLTAGFIFDEYVVCDADGNRIVAFPGHRSADGVPGYLGITRLALADALWGAAVSAGAEVRLGVEIADYTDTDVARVRFSDGGESGYDLVVGCEGLRSPLRTRLFGPEVGPVFTGYSTWRVKLPRRVDAMTKFAGPTTAAGLVPISADDMYLFHVTAEPGNPRHDQDAWPELLRERLTEYGGPVGEVREELSGSDIVYSPLFEVRLPAPWYSGRAVVIGDAAHALVPHLSQGGAQALEDAVVLAEELGRGPLAEALPRFMGRRFERTRHLQRVSAGLLAAEMTGPVAEPGEMAREMAAVRAFVDQPV